MKAHEEPSGSVLATRLKCFHLASPTYVEENIFGRYRDAHMAWARDDLQSLMSDSRYDLDHPGTLWHSDLQSVAFDGKDLRLVVRGQHNDRSFNFHYVGVRQFRTTTGRLQYPPSFILQELISLRRRWLQHTWSDLGGNLYTVICDDLRFEEAVDKG
jgi:hypothetical protein